MAAQMLLLCAAESIICFLLLMALLCGGAPLQVGPISAGALFDSGQAAAIAGMLTVLIVILSTALGLYRPQTFLRTRVLLIKVMVAAVATLPLIWQGAKAMGLELGVVFGWSDIWPLEMLVAWASLLLASRLLYSWAIRSDLLARCLVVVGDDADAERLGTALREREATQFRIGSLTPAGSPAGTSAGAGEAAAPRRPWAVVLGRDTDPEGSAARRWRAQGVRVWSSREFWERQLGRVDLAGGAIEAADSEDCHVRGGGPRSVESALRRVLDIGTAIALLLLTLPLMLLTALLIKLESDGPVIYRQERVGLHGRVFKVAKFRSMRVDAEASGPVWAVRRDPRVTLVGRFIRKVRIDELPQLFNVLSGEMSVIGPRPERPHFVEQLKQAIPGYAARARVKPGLTGWAQVNYPYGASVEDARSKLSYDLYYVKHRSLLLDLMILLDTVRVVLFQEGAR